MSGRHAGRDAPFMLAACHVTLTHPYLPPQVQAVYYGRNARVEALLQCEGPLWGRQYFFWHAGKPLTLIYEVFSPRLGDYLLCGAGDSRPGK